MNLSIIIVNYNSRDRIKRALATLQIAAKGILHEIIIVDNASVDFSAPIIKSRFPDVTLVENEKNEGFSKAANQGIDMAQGEYILLINPDTLTSEDTLHKTLAFMDSHPQAGGMGVRMTNADGQFLPESKRGLPAHWAFFFKLTGFYKHFPKSRLLNRYHADWTEEFEVCEVDLLSAAFMLLRKSAFQTIGLFDERFFIYGQDIDLSYRLRLAGYKNYYFPATYVVHLKGLSLDKFSWKYISNFYGAMFIFAAKYFVKSSKKGLSGVHQLDTPAI